MNKMIVVVAAAMLAAICHGSAVYYNAQNAKNVDCSYAQTVMHMAEEGKVKLTDGEKRMIQVARVQCSKFATSLYEEDVLIRQMGPSDTPSPSSSPTGNPPPPSPFIPGPVCPCKCSDKAWAEHECKRLVGRCMVTKMGCPHGKFMCCGIAH